VKRKKSAAGAIIFLIMAAVIAFLMLKTVFVVRSVAVTDESPIGQDAIIRASGIEFGSPLTEVDAVAVENGINALGKVKFEGMKRVLPGEIRIQVSERKGAGMVLHMGKILVLDAEGYAVEERDAVPDSDLVYVSDMGVVKSEIGKAVEGDLKRIEAYRRIMEAVERHNAGGMISEISLAELNKIRIFTRSGTAVYIGSTEKINDKIAWMKAVSADLDLRGESGGSLDVSSAVRADYMPPAG